MYPARAVQAAQDVAVQNAVLGREVDQHSKQQVRGGSVVQFVREDPGARKVERACVLNAPIQTFLNKAFAAEAALTACVDDALTTSCSATCLSAEAQGRKSKACDRNLAFVSGENGRAVVKDMTSCFLSYSEGPWHDLDVTSEEKHSSCLAMLCGMGDAWHRLVFTYDQPKYLIFEVCRGGEYDSGRVGLLAGGIRRRSEACSGCVDPFFARPWADRLLDHRPAVARKAHGCLQDVLSCLLVSSARCERKHLLGQETKGARRRGRALQCKTLSKVTYAKSVELAAAKARESVLKQCVGDSSKLRRSFAQAAASLRVGRWRQRRRDGLVEARAFRKVNQTSSRLPRVRSFDVFIRENFASQPEGLTMAQKRQRLNTEWKSLNRDCLPHYDGKAEAETKANEELDSADFQTFMASQTRRHLGTDRSVAMKRRAVDRTFRAMHEHPVWSAGAQLACFDSGIKPELVAEDPDESMRTAANELFRFDDREVPTRKHTMKPFKACCLRFGGLCQSDPIQPFCTMATKNMIKVFSSQQVNKSMPLLVRIQVGGVSEQHFVAKIFSKDDMAILVTVETSDDGLVSLRHVNGEAVIATSHNVFKRILIAGARGLRLEPKDIDSIELTVINFKQAESDNFVVQLGAEAFASSLGTKRPLRQAVRVKATLPFGLSFEAAKQEYQVADVDIDGGSSDSSGESKVLAARSDEEGSLHDGSCVSGDNNDLGTVSKPEHEPLDIARVLDGHKLVCVSVGLCVCVCLSVCVCVCECVCG
jgi:hypothetical protein